MDNENWGFPCSRMNNGLQFTTLFILHYPLDLFKLLLEDVQHFLNRIFFEVGAPY